MSLLQIQMDGTAGILLALCIILIAGFLFTRLTNLFRLPKVTGYIIVGVLIGPGVLGLIPSGLVDHMDFVSDIALACIAFSVGKFFKLEKMRQTGLAVIFVTLAEALMAGILVTLSVWLIFHTSIDFALLLGAVATATAPASTIMTIRQYHAKGEFVRILLQVVALDDAVCLLAFSAVSAVVTADFEGTLTVSGVLLPPLYNVLALLLGGACAWALSRIITPARSKDSRLILLIAGLLGISGLCALVDVSPLMSCMLFGAVYVNLTNDKKLFHQLDNFTPPVMALFFIESGMKLDVASLKTAGLVGIVYFLVRIIGKYAGAWFSCRIMHLDKKVGNYLGLGLIPQAGVSIGLAALGQRILPPQVGTQLLTIILSSSVLYEMIGPACAKFAILRSGSIHGE
ncbi:cation:proton antiporter [Murimonas intestini]|uniref:Transporter (CPA2 family) n=1 Tax=Murimonas intestini TaxID=1337051 RepID=A0AB73TB98_9FIRM|nr:cation:proton antiporter [Murimonas intestini]MCR1838752.1 cation:proton antiporter [Murimonas intestini]MCR1864052.1 cation:proton antiporter [Murimonas intestini]MCR1881662.1 cation:proton antiporter [Murimonas intestini]